MARWKLLRQDYGTEEHTFFEGNEVTVGRDLNNTVTLKSLVISRNHCILYFKKDEVLITDLKSANGVYVGLKKIPPNVPFSISDSDLIGLGWTNGVQGNIQDNQKFIYKLIKEKTFAERIKFQNQDDLDFIEAEIASINKDSPLSSPKLQNKSPILKSNSHLKRKLSLKSNDSKKDISIQQNKSKPSRADDDVVVLSDSECDDIKKNCFDTNSISSKKIKMESNETENVPCQVNKCENENLEYEAYNIKQEYLGFDEDPIQIDSDTDSESEQWFLRLSQSSPGKPFEKIKEKLKTPTKDTSYSQLEDEIFDNDVKNVEQDCNNESELDELLDDLITIPEPPPPQDKTEVDGYFNKGNTPSNDENEMVEKVNTNIQETNLEHTSKKIDQRSDSIVPTTPNIDVVKKIQMIEPLGIPTRKKNQSVTEKKIKSSLKKNKRSSKTTSPNKRRSITDSQKEERKKKLKDIASKEKDEAKSEKNLVNNTNKPIVNVKVTASNRGAFLTDVVEATIKPTTRKVNNSEAVTKHSLNLQNNSENNKHELSADKNKCSKLDKYNKESNKTKHSKIQKNNLNKSSSSLNMTLKESGNKLRTPTKHTKLLKGNEDSKKPVSRVEPFPHKAQKKKVRFSDKLPEVHEFIIEPGNRMKKTSSAKTAYLEKLHKPPVYSLEKVTLMKILRWNPQWLNEQMNTVEPPPILGHNNLPMALFHSFENHDQYVEMIGDLLLIEIWECLTQGFLKERNDNNLLLLRIESLPPVPTQERYFELINISVNISVPSSNTKKLPRVGEIMNIEFGPENDKACRFFYVNNVRTLPSPSNNKFSFFSISLYATFTEKMKFLKPGGLITGKKLAYIHKELTLFEAMENLAESELSEAILRPKPQHFPKYEPSPDININSQWTVDLNPSQKLAVSSSISSALGKRPSIQMVQGPPGTGKSSVICAIVMSYFYNAAGKRQNNRGKILICATSNAAVDELLIRLLNIRQKLPKAERFRMVRVGRIEAMHPRARDVSSQQLAQRDARSQADAQLHSAALDDEIAHMEAKMNMWKTNLREAKDPVRVAYCEGRVSYIASRLAMLRGGGGGGAGPGGGAGAGGGAELRGELLLQSERRIIEYSDIVVTTLGSAHSHKMKGIKGRIALCIVDEAGQAIEPEALIPLTLGVARLTLIGDPQQLPGFICSQRAKKHGLGESLFSRLTSVSEQWGSGSPVVLLDQQYRMHAHIADYPNRAFYGGRIHNMTPDSDLPVPPYCVVNVSSGDKGQAASGANETEAWGVARLAGALAAELRARRLSVALITPYAAQRDLLQRCLRDLYDPATAEAVEVNTVDSFQGQERDVVLVSLARSHGVGFLNDTGRMNVMLTRARRVLLVCLNPLALTRNHQWRTLVEDAQRRNVYTSLPNRICQGASTETIPTSEVLKCITCLKPKSKR